MSNNISNINSGPTTKDYLKKVGFDAYVNIVNSITGPTTVDNFETLGTITPDQFILSGDLLTSKCKTWTWESGEKSKQFSYLPSHKQFLMSRNCPCINRVKDMENFKSDLMDVNDDNGDEWSLTISDETNNNMNEKNIDDIPDIDNINDNDIDNDNLISDDDDDFCLIDDDDEQTLKDDNIIRTRSYDIYITYDQYHQCPKVYIQGYSQNGIILTPEQMYLDISKDYLHKTVSVEMHPHLSIYTIFIHPCRHAEIMKKFISVLKNSKNDIKAEQCLFLFLKFVSSVIPTINYDFTFDI